MKGGMGSGRREVEGKEGSLGRGSLPWAGGYKVGQRKSWGEEDHGKVENRRAECNHRAVEEEWRAATQSF